MKLSLSFGGVKGAIGAVKRFVAVKDDPKAPRKYALAYNSFGHLGLILSERPKDVGYSDGNVGQAWTGVYVLRAQGILGVSREVGNPLWTDEAPRVIAVLDPQDGAQLARMLEERRTV